MKPTCHTCHSVFLIVKSRLVPTMSFFLFFAFGKPAFTQTSFELEFGKAEEVEYVISMAETGHGSYLALLRVLEPIEGKWHNKILETDPSGNIITEKILDDNGGLQLDDIYYADSIIIMAGTRVQPDTSMLVWWKMDTNLNIVRINEWPIGDFDNGITGITPFANGVYLTCSFIDNKFLTFNSYVLEIDSGGNLIDRTDGKVSNLISRVFIDTTNERLVSFGFRPKLYTFDHEFNLLGEEEPPFKLSLEGEFSAISDSTILMVGRRDSFILTDPPGSDGYNIGIGFLSHDFEEQELLIVGKNNDTLDTPCSKNTIALLNENTAMVGGTSNFTPGNWLYQDANSWFSLSSVDLIHRTLNWTKLYGGDAYYIMFGILAASDGGVIMYGSRHADFSIDDANGYILKVKADGTSGTSTNADRWLGCAAYPNPVEDWLVIEKNDEKPAQLMIYNALNQLVLRREFHGRTNQIDLKNMEGGVYTYLMETLDGRSQCSGKLFKH